MPRCQNVARVIDNRYIGETSALFKTELFVRQFMIPLNIALRTGLLNRPSAAEDAVVDEYLSIQRQVDCLPFQTSDSDFSYYNSLTFYKYFVDHLTAFTGDADKLNFFNKFKEIFMDLPKTVHAAWKKLARNDLKQRRRKKGRQIDLAMQLRVPNFILVAEQYSKEDLTKICVHLSHYFWVFSRPRESGVVFNFDSRLPLLGLHLQALHIVLTSLCSHWWLKMSRLVIGRTREVSFHQIFMDLEWALMQVMVVGDILPSLCLASATTTCMSSNPLTPLTFHNLQ
jgi:hypothetical protein